MFFDDTLPFAADLTADVQNMKDKGIQYVEHVHGHQRGHQAAAGDEEAGSACGAEPPERVRPRFRASERALMEGNFIEPLYMPWETDPQSPATKAYLAAIKAITKDPVELTEFGWINAMQFVDGLKGAGPEFTQQKVINYLNTLTAYSPAGLVPPINW